MIFNLKIHMIQTKSRENDIQFKNTDNASKK